MGGTTITKVGASVGDLLCEIVESIKCAVESGLYPDGDVFALKPSTGDSFMLHPNILGDPQDGEPIMVSFEPLKEGHVGFAVTVASCYGPKPKENEWVVGVHIHT